MLMRPAAATVDGERAAGTPRSCSLNVGSTEELLVRLENPPGAKLRERQRPENPLVIYTARRAFKSESKCEKISSLCRPASKVLPRDCKRSYYITRSNEAML